MQISSLARNEGAAIYYNIELRNILEDHLTYFRNSNDITILNIEPAMAYKYEGDFFGLLSYYNVPFEYHWLVLRINKMTNPNQNKSTLLSVNVPNRLSVERLKNVYMTRNRIVH